MPMNQSRIHHAETRKKQPRFRFLIDKAHVYTRGTFTHLCGYPLYLLFCQTTDRRDDANNG